MIKITFLDPDLNASKIEKSTIKCPSESNRINLFKTNIYISHTSSHNNEKEFVHFYHTLKMIYNLFKV